MKKYRVTVNGTAYEIELEEITGAVPAPTPAAAPAAPAAPAPAPAAPADGGHQQILLIHSEINPRAVFLGNRRGGQIFTDNHPYAAE